MPRAFWKGAISFGMVVIPVKMYTATQESRPSFHMLHNRCFTRPKRVWYCPVDDEYFGNEDTVRGYEYAKDQYVVMSEEDFEKIEVPSSRTIDIFGFVQSSELDPIYYFDTHYLEPEKIGLKPFSLLREALLKTDRVGMAKVTFQRREHLASLRPADGTLYLHSLHYADNIRGREGLLEATQQVSAEELNMATSLINAMATEFKPEEYRDEYAIALQQAIEAKVRGEEIQVPKPERVEIPDLMTALRRSIEEAEKKAAEKEAVAR